MSDWFCQINKLYILRNAVTSPETLLKGYSVKTYNKPLTLPHTLYNCRSRLLSFILYKYISNHPGRKQLSQVGLQINIITSKHTLLYNLKTAVDM